MNEISTDQESQDYIEGTTFDKADGINLMLVAIVIFLVIHVSILGAVAYAIWLCFLEISMIVHQLGMV